MVVNSKFKYQFTLSLIAVIAQIIAYLSIFYVYNTRTQFYNIFICYAILLMSYAYLLNCEYTKINLFKLSIFLRIIPLASLPYLSDDFYRFLWDGYLLHAGINPYKFIPTEVIRILPSNYLKGLFTHLNSPYYYSVYPTINQLLFYLSTWSQKIIYNVIALRCILILFDVGVIYLIKKSLILKKINKKAVYIYALNPLVIIEFAGNLHLEVVMIFFTLLALYWILIQKNLLSAIAISCAICVKLIPLIFLPILLRNLNKKQIANYLIIVFITCLIISLPLINTNESIKHIFESIHLYYGKFEFNGSIYQILKSCGLALLGYNPIYYTSKIIFLITLLTLLLIYRRRSLNKYEGIFWCLFFYLLFSAIVHPWYIIFLVAISPFLKWKFAIVWSGTIFLSYYTYKNLPYQENLYFLGLEYLIVLGFVFYEMYKMDFGLVKISEEIKLNTPSDI